MSDSILSEIAKQIPSLIHDAVDLLIHDTDFRYEVRAVKVIKKRDQLGISYDPVILIEIVTNNRPLLLGQFLYFPAVSIRGFHNDWIEGYLLGYFTHQFGPLGGLRFHVEAFPFDYGSSEHVHRYFSLDEATKSGLIAESSPLSDKMREYDLRFVHVEGSLILGPDLGMIRIVENFASRLTPDCVVDLFCGTGSLTKVALMNGALNAICVDKNIKMARKNLKEFEDRVRFVEGDVFDFRPLPTDCGLVIADPFSDHAYDVARRLSAIYSSLPCVFVLDVCFIEDLYWGELVIAELRKSFKEVRVLADDRIVLAVCDGQQPYSIENFAQHFQPYAHRRTHVVISKRINDSDKCL